MTLMHFSLFKSIVEINRALPFWKMLAYVFLLAILGTIHCSGFVRLISTVCPSARCALAANAVGKHLDIFAIGAISLNHIYTH
jgi:hypothetical protein